MNSPATPEFVEQFRTEAPITLLSTTQRSTRCRTSRFCQGRTIHTIRAVSHLVIHAAAKSDHAKECARAALGAILWNHWVVQSGPTRCQSLLQADIRRVSSSRRPVRKTAAKTSPHPFQVAVATMTA